MKANNSTTQDYENMLAKANSDLKTTELLLAQSKKD